MMDRIIEDFKNYVNFYFYENSDECEIVISNDQDVLMRKIVSKTEGEQILFKRCLFFKYLELVPSFDTIGLKNSDKFYGFVRYIRTDGVIEDLNYHLLPKFLCSFLEVMSDQAKRVEVSYQIAHFTKKLIVWGDRKEKQDPNSKDFYFTFGLDPCILAIFHAPYLVEEYLSRHKDAKINGGRLLGAVELDNICFPYEFLNESQKKYIDSKLSEQQLSSYSKVIQSSFYKKLNSILDENDTIQFVKVKDKK